MTTDSTHEARIVPGEAPKACPNPWCESHRYEDGGPKVPDDLWGLSGSNSLRIGCHYCTMKGPARATEAEAVTAWNERPAATPSASPADLEAEVLPGQRPPFLSAPAFEYRDEERACINGCLYIRADIAALSARQIAQGVGEELRGDPEALRARNSDKERKRPPSVEADVIVERLGKAVYDYQCRMGLASEDAAEDAGGMAEEFQPIIAALITRLSGGEVER